MKTSKPRSTYHHGDLKAALLVAARALLDDGGVAAVSLREVARRAGVTPAACYRHFADKDALLIALAVQGFGEFAEAMRAAYEGSSEPFADMGVAYVQFAVERPGLFRLMFGPAVADRGKSPELLEAIARSTHMFDSGMKTRQDVKPDDPVAALRSWATMHGLATLAIDQMLPGYDPVMLARALAKKLRPPS
ncbi:MAG TPA: TetR/AcrR family transcriptional regulator [Rhizobacter sp.]|nr:TetR/AcrR family transcriptional regulator [Rhizobacter sp.]